MTWLKRFKRFPYFFQWLYVKVTASIAFLPMVITMGFIFVVLFLLYLESVGLTSKVDQKFPSFLLLKSWDIAQSILTVLIGALISLMVFSFSMVMVLLNNASSNFSPRILPNLISNKFHQIVLGTYLGTITFSIILTINLTPNQPKFPLPSFSVLIAILLGLICLLLFVFFIHSISESVQVGKILVDLNNSTLDKLEKNDKLNDDNFPVSANEGYTYFADRSGYINKIKIQELTKICEKENLLIKVLVSESWFILNDEALFICNKKVDERIEQKILSQFVMSKNETTKDDPNIGFKQITEIAVKAMSPGINDPGTALSAINILTILFSTKMGKMEGSGINRVDESDNKLPTILWLNIISFDRLLYFVLSPLRQYSRHDLMVMLNLLKMLQSLFTHKHCHAKHRNTILREVDIILEDAKEHITNATDLSTIQSYINLNFYKKVRV